VHSVSFHVENHSVDNLVNRETRGIDHDGIGGGFHRGNRARPIASISRALIVQNRIERRLLTSGLVIFEPSVRTLKLAGGEEKLPKSIGKDKCALIAAFRDDVAFARDSPLPDSEALADALAVSDIFRRLGDLHRADRFGDIFVAKDHALSRELDDERFDKCSERRLAREFDPSAQAGQGDSAVHRACIQKPPSEPFGKPTRDCAFARSGRSVDRDDTLHRGLAALITTLN
jgi:hypothetical protein